jgi:hypothetical protein
MADRHPGADAADEADPGVFAGGQVGQGTADGDE